MIVASGRHSRSDTRGQALVEFTLVAPLLFLVVIGIFEVGRYILFQQTLNNATREGARYAIVHGANSSCPSGPWPADHEEWGDPPSMCNGAPYPSPGYDTDGRLVMDRVEEAATGLLSLGELKVGAPIWTDPAIWAVPDRSALTGPEPHGDNARGAHVTVFADFAYDTIIDMILNTDLLPQIEMRTESTLVVNN